MGFCAKIYWHNQCVLVLPVHSMEKDHDNDIAFIDDDEEVDYEKKNMCLPVVMTVKHLKKVRLNCWR